MSSQRSPWRARSSCTAIGWPFESTTKLIPFIPLLPRKPSLLEQRLDLRIASAEGAVHRRRVLGAAAGEDHFAEAVAVRAGHAAVFLEPVVGVVVEHFAPEVGVVAGRVAAAPDVRKVRR